MLSFFRRGIWAKLMLVILGIALFAIVITGFGTGGVGGLDSLAGGSGSIASVESERISAKDVQDQAQRQLRQAQQRQPGLDMPSFLRGGALEEIVSQLVTMAARTVFGRDQGLAAPKALVDRQILAIPSFQNLAGQFDDAAFRRALAEEGISEGQLRADIEKSLIERQLMLPVAASAFVPEGLATQYASLWLEGRTGTVGQVPVSAMGGGIEPTEGDIAKFYQTNRARYTIPERRSLRYALFGTEHVAAQAAATEAEIAARYKRNSAQYAPRESRSFSQVVLQDEKAARALAQRIAGGMSFAQAASQAGFSAADTALGELSRDEVTRRSSAAVAAAAYSTPQGKTTAPVKSPFGWHLIRVDSVRTVPGKPLEAVRAELAAAIQSDKSIEALTDMINRIDRATGDGASLEDVARSEKLTLVETPAVTGAGSAPDNAGWAAPPELPALLRASAGMTEDDDPLVETIVENQRFALVQVVRVIPAAPPPLAAIHDRVKSDLIARRALDRARAVAASIVAKINAGTAPAAAFAQADLPLSAPATLSAKRSETIPRQGVQIPAEKSTLFSLAPGKARLIARPDGSGWMVVQLASIQRGDPKAAPQVVAGLRGEFAQVMGDEYDRQFTNAIKAGMDVERNDKAVAALRKQLGGGGE
ncbi:MAG TPA: SurA N-terminal domain-containing protein [Allosphingosinicella sp.]|nr:SurA N-terminal domain-containing protein [Allosphingosinicella sp.]